MGTDITMYAERRNHQFDFGPYAWEIVGVIPDQDEIKQNRISWHQPNPDWSAEENARDLQECCEGDVLEAWQKLIVMHGRDYEMFGFLADVKNRWGSPVISAPRGLPLDLSYGIRRALEQYEKVWGTDYMFSHSWLLLRELCDYDYSITFTPQDLLEVELRKLGIPTTPLYKPWYWKDCEVKLRDFLATGAYDDGIFSLMQRLLPLGDPSETRLVFWFDC